MTAAPERPARLCVRDLRRSFGARVVLDGLCMERDAPGVIGLAGPNGSGKTTLLRILAQVLQPDSGSVEVGGLRVERGDELRARELVGWVPHAPLAWQAETVERNLAYAARLAGRTRHEARRLADEAIGRWGLDEVRTCAVATRSRGWQQRYAVARADLLRPPVLLLDEPTTGLDARARELLDEAIGAWRRERVVVVSSHDRAWLDAVADQRVELA